MGLYLYDEALTNKIKKWTSNASVRIYSPNDTYQLFSTISDSNNDSPLQLPLISISRPGGYTILNMQKRPLTFDGMRLDSVPQRSMQLNAIPISIEYQFDIYCRYLKEADEYARNLIFNIINYPKLTINIPYENYDLAHNSTIRLSSSVEDNSDISERIITGQFSRLTLGVMIDDAYLFDIHARDNKYIDAFVGTDD